MSGYTERLRINDYVGPGIYAEVTWPLPCLSASGRHTFGRVSQACISCGTPARITASTPEPGFSSGEEEELERESEREALRREERQAAMLDAGGILAEYRQAKGE